MSSIPIMPNSVRKLWSALPCLVILLLALAAAGCGDRADREAGADATGAETGTSKGGGGELRVLVPLEPANLDPNDFTNESMVFLGPNLFSKLVALDADLRLLPDLAERWTVADGGLTYTFALRPQVRWHDGRPFTSRDVRWTFEQIARRKTLAQEAVAKIVHIETPDDHQIVLRLREPWAPFLSTLASEGPYILPRPETPRTAGAADPAAAPPPPVGTGPFRFREWVRGDHITLDAHHGFHRPGPFLDRVTFRFEPDVVRGAALLVAGKADYFAGRPALPQILRLARDPRVRVISRPSSMRYYCGFNLRHAALQDVRVRTALNLAIDRARVVQQALLGYGTPAQGFYTPSVGWAYHAGAAVPAFAPDRAVALLDEAGLRPGADGVRLRLRLVAADLPPFRELAEEVRRQLAPLGVEVQLDILPHRVLFQKLLAEHDFDLGLIAGNQGPDPENLNARFGSRGHVQFMGYSSPDLDAAVAAGAATVEIPERAKAYFRAQEILARDLPILPLAEGVNLAVARPGVVGLPQTEARGLVAHHEYSLVRLQPEPRGGRR